MDTDADENGSSEDRDGGDGAKRKRKSAKDKVMGGAQNMQGGRGKGKATTLHDQLLPSVSERNSESSAEIEEIGDRDSSTIGKQDILPSGSTA